MPKVPTYEGRQVRATPLPGVRRTPQQAGAGVGAAIAEFGDTAARVGTAAADAVFTELQQRADQTALYTAERQLGELEQLLLHAPDRGALTTVKGKDTLGLRQTVTASFDAQAGMIAGNLTNDRQRVAFEAAKEARRRSLIASVDAHTTREIAAYETNEAKAAIDTAVNLAIANAEQRPRIDEELGRLDVIVEQSGDRLGLTGPQARAAFLAEARSRVHEGVITRLLTLDRDGDAEQYFADRRDQMTGESIARVEGQVQAATTEGKGFAAAEEIWAALGPVDDTDPINLDQMETEARTRFAKDPKVLKATIDYLRERKTGVDAGRREREDATLTTLWSAVLEGRPMREIARMPAFLSAPGRVQVQVRDYLNRQAEHQANVAYLNASRANAEESRRYQALIRADRLQEMRTWAAYAKYTDPATLRGMTHGQVLDTLPELGAANTQKLLNDWEALRRGGDDAVRAATIDAELLKLVAKEAGLDYAFESPSQRNDAENATMARLEVEVLTEISRRQQGGKALTYEEKRQLAQEMVGAKVRINDWFTDSYVAGALVNPDDRRRTYVLLDDIDAAPQIYGQAYKDYLNYLRGLPGNARLTDQELRRRFTVRIQNAMGRRFAGASREEIEAALKGVE